MLAGLASCGAECIPDTHTHTEDSDIGCHADCHRGHGLCHHPHKHQQCSYTGTNGSALSLLSSWWGLKLTSENTHAFALQVHKHIHIHRSLRCQHSPQDHLMSMPEPGPLTPYAGLFLPTSSPSLMLTSETDAHTHTLISQAPHTHQFLRYQHRLSVHQTYMPRPQDPYPATNLNIKSFQRQVSSS